MRKSRFTEAQSVTALGQAEGGVPVADLCRKLDWVQAAFQVSRRGACAVTGVHRSLVAYRSRRPSQEPLAFGCAWPAAPRSEISDECRQSLGSVFRALLALRPAPTVGDLPELMKLYREDKAKGVSVMFARSRAMAQGFIRDTLGRSTLATSSAFTTFADRSRCGWRMLAFRGVASDFSSAIPWAM